MYIQTEGRGLLVNLPTKDKTSAPNVSVIQRFHSTDIAIWKQHTHIMVADSSSSMGNQA